MSGGEGRGAARLWRRGRDWLAAWWVPVGVLVVFGTALWVSSAHEATSMTPERYAGVVATVLPREGYRLPITWGDLGPTLVRLGVIDPAKLGPLFAPRAGDRAPELRLLEAPSEAFITITAENERFVVAVLWGLGLANRSPVLETARATRRDVGVMRLASTAGWTLGAKPAAELYGQFDILRLTPAQQALVADLAPRIHRPCCGNPTAFPDCNHGMAMLGLIELMAAHGFSRDQILTAALRFNAFWFPREYTRTAVLFELRGVAWEAVDPEEILGPRYSSLGGWRASVDRELQKVSHRLPPDTDGARCDLSP